MRFPFLLTLLVASSYAHADTCIITPFEDDVAQASTAFIATVTAASLDSSVQELRNGGKFRVSYAFTVREIFKGDPATVSELYTSSMYTDYDPDIAWSASDHRLRPGDHVLVLATRPGNAQIGSCTLSQPWADNPAKLKLLRSLGASRTPSNNSFKPKPLRGSA